MQIESILSPEFEEIEARYLSIINDIYREAQQQMFGASLRSQQHIRRCAVEQARPFNEEIGRLRGLVVPCFIVKEDAA